MRLSNKPSILNDLRNPAEVIFWLLVILWIALIWSFRFFPSQDGPTFVYNAKILRDYATPGATAFRNYFEIALHPVPYWFSHALLYGLLHLFSPIIAEKVLLTCYVAGLPLAARYVLRALNPQAAPLAIFVFPLVGNYFFQMGFYNQCFSLVLLLWIFGVWLRARTQPSLRSSAAIGLLLIVLYFTHLSSLAMCMVAIFTFFAWEVVWNLRHSEQSPRDILQRAALLLVPALPALGLAFWYLRKVGAHSVRNATYAALWKMLVQMDVLISFSAREIILSRLTGAFYGVLLGGLLIHKCLTKSWSRIDGLFAVFLAFLIFFLQGPSSMASAGDLHLRASLYPALFLCLWVGVQPLSRHVSWLLALPAVVLSVAFLFSFQRSYREMNIHLTAYEQVAAHVEPNKTILGLNLSNVPNPAPWGPRSVRVNPFAHAVDYLAAEKNLVDLTNMNARFDYFPIRFRPDRQAIGYIEKSYSSSEFIPPRVDLETFSRETGGRIDYVLLVGRNDWRSAHPDTLALDTQLARGFVKIYEAAQPGFIELYQNKIATHD